MPRSTRNLDIERLRAIAAVAVLVGHVPWLQTIASRTLHFAVDPWTGVDLFFVISGFVVSAAFERDLSREARGVSMMGALPAFYLKRAARILPTAYLSLALWWIGSTWLNQSGAWGHPLVGRDAAWMIASGMLMVSNWRDALGGITMPLFWYWSLCVEEQFYLIYPMFRLATKTTGRRIAAVIAVIAAVHIGRLLIHDSTVLRLLSNERVDEIASGVLIGVVWQRWPARAGRFAARLKSRGVMRRVGALALLLLLAALGALPSTLLMEAMPRFGYVLIGLCATGIVALASCDADLLAWRAASSADWLSALGSRSYGLYMFHVPALWLVVEARTRLFARPNSEWLYGPELVAYAAVLACMVEANYRYVERPLNAWARARTEATFLNT